MGAAKWSCEYLHEKMDLSNNQLYGIDSYGSEDYDGEDYDASGITALASALAVNTSLESLDLSNTHLCGISELGIGEYNGSGIEAVTELMSVRSPLKTLSLSGNKINEEDSIVLFAATKRSNVTSLCGFEIGQLEVDLSTPYWPLLSA